jgi:hypothetical protein
MAINNILEDGIATLSMELGRGNAIDDAFIAALHGALDSVGGPEVRAVVLTGQGRTFSGGYTSWRSTIWIGPPPGFVDAFDGVFERLTASRSRGRRRQRPRARGRLRAPLACDHQIMAPGDHVIGLSGRLGISFPAAATGPYRHAVTLAVGRSAARGRRFSAEGLS